LKDPAPPSKGDTEKDFIRTELPVQYIKELPNIENLLSHLEGKGRKPATLQATEKGLKALALRADLKDTKAVELAIARYIKKNGRPATNSYKSKLCDCYQHYCKLYHIEWEKPTYTPEPTSIQPPSNEKCQMLISAAKGELSLKIDLSNATGLRPCEIVGEFGLEARDIHPDQNTITARIHKGCDARPPIPIRPELTARLQAHITKHNLQSQDRLFKGTSKKYGETFRTFRNRLAKKLNDPTIHNIRLYDIRHAYCTKQLKRTQNTEIVRQIMGHKHLNTTQKYLHLLGFGNTDWIVEGTDDKERTKQLLKEDFQYQLTTPDGTMIFKKPK
jgi:integrase